MDKTSRLAVVDLITNVVVVMTCVILVCVVVYRQSQASSAHDDSSFREGQTIEPPVERTWRTAKSTLVLGVRSGSSFCTASAEFYRRIMPIAKGQGVSVIAVSQEPVSATLEYMARLSLNPDSVHQVGPRYPLALRTPTLSLIDEDGRVVAFWIGKLDLLGEKEVERSLGHVPANK